MATSREYRDFIMEQLADLVDLSCRPMMGEYLLSYGGKVIGGIYDDRLLVKPVAAAAALMPEARRELPYEGAKEMLLVEEVENREFLRELVLAVAAGLPDPKPRRKKRGA